MNPNNPLELLRFVQGTGRSESEQLKMLAALSDAPGEDYEPKMLLPQQNEIPAFSINTGGIGSEILGHDYGLPAPVPGQEREAGSQSIGELIVGERS